MSYPRSPYDQVGDLVWVPRMFDKARMQQNGELDEAYQPNLGIGHDGRCCKFLRINYADVKTQIAAGSSDSEVLEWCFENGRKPDESDIELWNGFMTKLGWGDKAQEFLNKRKETYGLSNRDDIQTLFQLIEVDEERM